MKHHDVDSATEPIRLLIVEDNPGDVRLIEHLLDRATNFRYSVEVHDRLSTVLEQCTDDEHQCDVILLDLNLPDSQGFDTFAAVHAAIPHVPIIVLTVSDDDELAIKAVHYGAQDYLVKGKPRLNTDSLVRAVRYAIERQKAEEAVAHSEQKYRDLVENPRNIIVTVDTDGIITFINEYGATFFGYSVNELIGKDVMLFIPKIESTGRPLTPLINDILAHPDNHAVNVNENITKDGRRVWVNWTNKRLTDARGHHVGHLAIGNDVTEQKQAQDELHRELMINAALAALYAPLIDPTLGIFDIMIAVRDQARALTGSEHGYVSIIDPETHDLISYSHTRMVGEGLCTVPDEGRGIVFPIGPDGRYNGLYGHALNTKQAFYTNAPDDHPAAKGTPEGHIPLRRFLAVPVLIDGELVGDVNVANADRNYTDDDLYATGKVAQFYALAIQRMRVEEEAESQAKFPEEDPNPVFRVNASGEVLYANKAGQTLLTDWDDLEGDVVDQVIRDAAIGALSRQERTTVEVLVGSRIYDFSVAPIIDQEYVNFYGRDNTAKKRAEEALEQAHHELEQKVKERTHELQEEIKERKAIEKALQAATEKLLDNAEGLRRAHDELEQIVQERTRELQMEIDERKVTEKELRVTTEDLQEKTAELEELTQELTRSNKELEQFAYIASHDLQEPLRTVASSIGLLEKWYKNKLGDEADTFINYAIDGTKHMQQLIKDLLAYARVTSRGEAFKPVHCDGVVQHAIDNLKTAIEESEVKITLTDTPLPMIVGDETQITQLFQNIIGNAIKFRSERPPEVRIGVELDAKRKRWQFSISDNGIGMDMQYADKIFTIFQRLHTTEQYPGTGVGLALCKKIVERHGGEIWGESELGKGTTFYFTLPFHADK